MGCMWEGGFYKGNVGSVDSRTGHKKFRFYVRLFICSALRGVSDSMEALLRNCIMENSWNGRCRTGMVWSAVASKRAFGIFFMCWRNGYRGMLALEDSQSKGYK